MRYPDKVLVAIMNNPSDFALARNENWYRIPVNSAEKWCAGSWPPNWLAFYQTKVFGPEAFAVNYFAKVTEIRTVGRQQLFPKEPLNQKSRKRYFQILFMPLEKLAKPIPSRKWRRITFIPTIWPKFILADEINDLYNDSPLEDLLWTEFKKLEITAERQEFVRFKERNYALDFAIYCSAGKIDVETDGDTWHANPQCAVQDNLRDNDLETGGWRVLRFSTKQLKEQMNEYCLPVIAENINKLGGLKEGKFNIRKIRPKPGMARQLGLFED